MRHHNGSLEIIVGSMFSGKTDELIRRLRRATIAKQHVQVFKPSIDTRYDEEKVTSHAGSEYAAIPINQSAEIHEHLEDDTTVVAIDEAQFFDNDVIEVAEQLADKGKRVIVAGLDQDFRGEPFGPIPNFMLKQSVLTRYTRYAWCAVKPHPAPSVWSTEIQLVTMIQSSLLGHRKCMKLVAVNITKSPDRDRID